MSVRLVTPGSFVIVAALACALISPTGTSARVRVVGGWFPDGQVTAGNVDPASVDLAFSPLRAVGVWRVLDGGTWRVQAAERSGPQEWGEVATLSPVGAQTQQPQVETFRVETYDEELVTFDHVAVWSGYDGTHWRIQYSLKRPGSPWTEPVMISQAGQDAVDPVTVSVLGYAGEGRVDIAWRRFDGAHWRVQSTSLQDGGAGVAIDLSDAGQDARDLTHTRGDNGGHALAWARYDGANWRAQAAYPGYRNEPFCCAQNISPPGLDAVQPRVGGQVAVWRVFDGAHWRIQSSRLGRQGWRTPRYLSPAGYDAEGPVAFGCNTTSSLALWRQYDGVSWRVGGRARPTSMPWTPFTYLSTSGVDASVPALSGCGGVVAWTEAIALQRVAKAAAFDGAANPPVKMLGTPGADVAGVVAINTSVAWVDETAIPHALRVATMDNHPPDAEVWTARFQKSRAALIRWSGVDDWAAALAFDVRVRSIGRNQRSWRVAPLVTNTSALSWSGRLRPGRTYCFKARARDTFGNQGAWSDLWCSATPVDDRSLSRHGAWKAKKGSEFYGKTYLESRSRGATLTLQVRGVRDLRLLLATGPGQGRVRVDLGGSSRVLDLNSKKGRKQVIRQPFPVMETARGELRITVLSQGKPVRIDGVYVARHSLFI